LDRWIDDSILQAVAAENNLSETAFLVRNAEGFDLRWFTLDGGHDNDMKRRTLRGNLLRIISAWGVNSKEKKYYEENQKENS
jgi:uncharacterized DUF497 family protein